MKMDELRLSETNAGQKGKEWYYSIKSKLRREKEEVRGRTRRC
jgi:hypothetical protein